MSKDQSGPPKIIVDDDWKSQAQAEKERLAEIEAKSAPAQGAAGPGGASGQGELPPADFSSLVGMLATQALMYLGGMEDKKRGGVVFDPEMGRFYIDLLAVVEDKCKGNLTEDEARDIGGALQELRMRFVELSKAIAAQMMRERGGADGAGGPGIPGIGGVGGQPMGPGPKLRVE